MSKKISPGIFREYDIRGLVDKDLTEEAVELIGRGLGTLVREKGGKSVAVGHDCRESGERFSKRFVRGINSTGLDVVDVGVVPTPLVYFAANTLPVDGLCMITGSHNPPEYNGIKFSTADGAPALPEVTKKIEAEIARAGSTDLPIKIGDKPQSSAIDVKQAYIKRLQEIVDFDVIRKSKLKVAFDPLWGAARGYSDSLLRDHGIPVESVHDYRDVLFGGHAPEPDGELLDECKVRGPHFSRYAFFETLYGKFAEPEVWDLYPEVREVLRHLGGKFKLGILSNFDGRLRLIHGGVRNMMLLKVKRLGEGLHPSETYVSV